jgi:hypothetical protein
MSGLLVVLAISVLMAITASVWWVWVLYGSVAAQLG